MAQTEEQEVLTHAIDAEEYSMIQAVIARISGLRMLMIGVAVIGVISSITVFIYETAYQISRSFLGNANNPLSAALSFAILSATPFMAIEGYLSYRVNKHIRRLSRGRYEPPAEEEY
ncbi:MAG: hypothetical protein JRN15_15155 [Nitrososphaerota archaeon]|nr:hypothetical protein [Nitrososphaerota archaeon]